MRRALILIALVAGCAPSTPPPVTATDAARTKVSLAELEAGRTLVIKRCGSCHGTPSPRAHTAHDWPHELDEMSARANLSPAERRSIEQYLVALAQR
ncbi:MAG TPA: hypothetical protein VGM88_12395 [Kofleriaceae bacterium]|jgi:cytochrome c5